MPHVGPNVPGRPVFNGNNPFFGGFFPSPIGGNGNNPFPSGGNGNNPSPSGGNGGSSVGPPDIPLNPFA